MKKDARFTAAQALMRLDNANAYSNLVLEPLTVQNELDGRETAFAAALFYTALERRLTIDHILRKYLPRPPEKLEPEVRAALRLGVCQLCFLDGVDDYAAVSETVALVKKLGADRASGVVNGVLRSFLRDDRKIPPATGTRAEQLEIQYSCPAWLIEGWTAAYGEPATLRMLEGSLGKPPVFLRANTLRLTAQELAQRLTDAGLPAHESDPTGCVAVEGKLAVERLDAFAQGLFHVQDRASQLCALALDAQENERVLDVCSAPGGKSFTVAEQMANTGEVVCRDLHEKRVELVRAGAARLGLTNITATAGDAGVYDPALGQFDRVLCDVPCSGFGIIRRKPEIKYKTPASIQNLPAVQYKILQTSAQYLKPGGTLVYSTCTLLPQENEQVVERLLAERTDFVCERQETYTGETQDTDGFFVAVLKRRCADG